MNVETKMREVRNDLAQLVNTMNTALGNGDHCAIMESANEAKETLLNCFNAVNEVCHRQ